MTEPGDLCWTVYIDCDRSPTVGTASCVTGEQCRSCSRQSVTSMDELSGLRRGMDVTTLGLNWGQVQKARNLSSLSGRASQTKIITIPAHYCYCNLPTSPHPPLSSRPRPCQVKWHPNRSQNHHLPPKPTSSTHNLHLQHALHQPSHRPRCVRGLHICRGCCRPARFSSRQPALCRPRLPRPELRRVREQGHHHWRVRRVDLLRLRSLLAEWLGETMAQHGFHLGMGQGKRAVHNGLSRSEVSRVVPFACGRRYDGQPK